MNAYSGHANPRRSHVAAYKDEGARVRFYSAELFYSVELYLHTCTACNEHLIDRAFANIYHHLVQ